MERAAGKYYFERISDMNFNSFIAIAAALCFAVVSFGCGGGASNTTTTTTANKPANTTTTTTTTTTNSAANTAANSEIKAQSAEFTTGVAECDEFIKKYEACLLTVQSKAPQAATGIKTGIETAKSTLKTAANSPGGKTALPATCKQMINSAKASTAQWCTW